MKTFILLSALVLTGCAPYHVNPVRFNQAIDKCGSLEQVKYIRAWSSNLTKCTDKSLHWLE